MPTKQAGSSHTNWALIYDAAHGDPLPSSQAIEHLVRRYWPAVYAFIRRSGHGVDDAADLTQAFVCDVILDRTLFNHADPARGRFRSLLMTSLSNYLHERRRSESREKRSPAVKPLQLENAEVAALGTAWTSSPEHAFCAQWNAMIIRDVLQKVHETCRKSGMEAHWQVFEARVVKPMLFDEPRVSYANLVERLELKDAGQAANMMVAVKRRFVHALVQQVAKTVSDPVQVEEELRSLVRDLESHS